MGLQLLHKALHAAALDLEYAVRLSGTDIVHHGLIIVIDLLHIQRRVFFSCHLNRILNHSQSPESQEIHLQKSQFLQRGHCKLGGDCTVRRPGKRNIFIHRLLTDHDSRRVHRAVAGKSFQTLRHINQILHLLIVFICSPQLRILLQGLVDRNIKLLRNHLGDAVHKGIWQIHHTPHIPDNASCRQRTESHDLHDSVLAVFAHNIIDYFLSSLETEVNVDIRHGHTLRIQESFKKKLIPDRIDGSDFQAV